LRALGSRFSLVSTPEVPSLATVKQALAAFILNLVQPSQAANPAIFEPVSARAVARTLAAALNQAVA